MITNKDISLTFHYFVNVRMIFYFSLLGWGGTQSPGNAVSGALIVRDLTVAGIDRSFDSTILGREKANS